MTEKHLLFAVLAFESDLIDLAQLTAACRAWVANKSKPIADLLVERGWITAEDRGFVEKQLERKLAKHQHDPRVTLNSVVRGDVCDAIKQVEDADIQQSLSSWPSSGPVLIETIGETLGEPEQPKSRYTWVSEVGKGGLGKVWLARDNDLAREVALKEVKPGSASTEAVRRLIKEAQITGQLQHPNIVPVYEVHRDGGRPFYTMKLVKGETLSKAIKKHHALKSRLGLRPDRPSIDTPSSEPQTAKSAPSLDLAPGAVGTESQPTSFAASLALSEQRLLNVFVNVCEALAYAHSRGIIHRDLKPENIVLGDYGEAIVLDWGLAKQIGSAGEETAPVVLTDDAQSQATRLGATPGTLAYMSPEQAAGRVDLMDHRTDVYGLGSILFEILTGRAPHRAAQPPTPAALDQDKTVILDAVPRPSLHASLHDRLQRICDGDTPRARDVDPTISRELDAICATAMSKKRDERYLNAKALAADIKRSLAHQPVAVYRTTPWERMRLWRRRNPVVAALSLFLAVSLLTGVAVSSFFALQSAARNRNLLKETTRANNKADEALANANKVQNEKDRADVKTNEALRHLYSAHMNLAQRNWEISQIGLVLDSLEKTRPLPGEVDLRGFEWHYWDRLCHSSLLDLKGHTGLVASVAFSADGRRLASASLDRTVKVWDTTNGQEMLTLKGHTDEVTSVVFCADGKRLASGSRDRTVKVWDATNGQETLTIKGHADAITSVTFSQDGRRLASASVDQTVKMWDATSGQETHTLEGHTGFVTSVAFSADGEKLQSASHDGTVNVWDLTRMRPATNGQELPTFGETATPFLWLKIGYVTSMAISANGNQLAMAIYDGRAKSVDTVKVWNAMSIHEKIQETLTLNGPTGRVRSLAFRADGKRLASAGDDQTVKVWDTTSGQETLTLKGHTGDITSVTFSPDGKRLASTSIDRTVKVWDATSDQESLTLKGHTDAVWSVAFSTDGKRLASANRNRTLKVWDTTSGQEMLTLNEDGMSVAFSPDGKRLASANRDGTLKVWDSTNGQEILTLKGHTGQVKSVAFSADGNRLASASYDGTVRVWDAMSGLESLTLKGHNGGVNSVAFSADGKRLASASWRGNRSTEPGVVKVWDAISGQETLTLKGHNDGAMSVAFNADGNRLASAGYDGTVKVWNATSGQEMLTLKGHTGPVASVAFSADGSRLASASGGLLTGSKPGEVKVWDTTSGQETLTLKGHTGPVTSVAFSADGSRLASSSVDGTVRVWDARPWTPELRAEREALSLIHWLRDQDKPQSEWLDAIEADQTISEPVRQRALQFVREWK